MSCRDELCLAYAEDALSPAERAAVAEHLAACAACRQAVTRVHGARAALRSLAQAEAPAVDVHRVQAAIMAALEAPVPRRWRWLWPSLAGACAVLAVAIGWRVTRPPSAGPGAPVGRVIATAPAAAAPLAALPILVVGEVKTLAGEPLSLQATLGAGAGARIGAGGRLVLQVGRGTGVVATAGSDVTLRALDTRDVVIYLGRGKLFAEVAHRAPGQRFVVVTPGHSVEVRGTRYSVERKVASTRVAVLEGEVEVHTVGTGWDAVGARVPSGAVIEFPDGDSPVKSVATGLSPEARAAFAAEARAPLLPEFADAANALARSSTLELGASPLPASTTFDRAPLGVTPLAVRAPRGRHTIEFSRDGAGRELRVVDLDGSSQRLVASLTRPEEDNARSAEVARTVREHLKTLRRCYEKGLRSNRTLEAVAELRITVGESGHITRVSVAPGSGLPPDIEGCLTDAVRRWRLTKGSPVTVSYPLVLRPELSFETP